MPLLLVAMPGATNSFVLLVVLPSALVTSSDALVTSTIQKPFAEAPLCTSQSPPFGPLSKSAPSPGSW